MSLAEIRTAVKEKKRTCCHVKLGMLGNHGKLIATLIVAMLGCDGIRFLDFKRIYSHINKHKYEINIFHIFMLSVQSSLYI